MLALLLPLVDLLADPPIDGVPEENDVVAGWGAFALFALLILAVVVLGFSLTKRLKNVERAAEEGLYDPSTVRKDRPLRGLAAHRQMQAQLLEQDESRPEQE